MSKYRTLSLGMLRHNLFFLALTLFLLCAMIPGNPVHAEGLEGYGESEGPVIDLTLKRSKPEMVLPLQYPDGFHGYGHIDVLGEDRVIIGDISMKLATNATFHTPTNMDSYIAEFSSGDFVGWLKNTNGEIASLWKIQ